MTVTRSQALVQLRDRGRRRRLGSRSRCGRCDASRPERCWRSIRHPASRSPGPQPRRLQGSGVACPTSWAPASTPRVDVSTLDISLRCTSSSTRPWPTDPCCARHRPRVAVRFRGRAGRRGTPVVTDLGDRAGHGRAPNRAMPRRSRAPRMPTASRGARRCATRAAGRRGVRGGGHYRELSAFAGLATGTANPTDRVHLDVRVDGRSCSRATSMRRPPTDRVDVTAHQRIDCAFTPVATTARRMPRRARRPGGPCANDNHAELGHAQLSTVGDVTQHRGTAPRRPAGRPPRQRARDPGAAACRSRCAAARRRTVTPAGTLYGGHPRPAPLAQRVGVDRRVRLDHHERPRHFAEAIVGHAGDRGVGDRRDARAGAPPPRRETP